ncbi:MAG: hypothetical protein V5A55_01055 [Halovenus sp.]
MRLRGAAIGLAVAPAVGASFVVTHTLWYRVFAQSATVDVLGSLALGLVSTAVYALVSGLVELSAWPWSLAAFGAGSLVHLLLTPAFTPFGLAARGVNTVLFVFGLSLTLWLFVRHNGEQ